MRSNYITKVKAAFQMVPQPNSYTCQSACIAMAIGNNNVLDIRRRLEQMGDPGDPACMKQLLQESVGNRYSFNDNANLIDAREALKQGAYCITHGWFTNSGHVIGLDGIEVDPATLSYRFNVKDPWSEFNFRAWQYSPLVDQYDGYYSSYGIYATCVAGQSFGHAADIFRRGELDSSRRGMWLHTIMP
jgi:hypothetical protein